MVRRAPLPGLKGGGHCSLGEPLGMWVLPCSSCSMACGPWQLLPPPPPHTHTSSQMEVPKSCSPAVPVDHPCQEAHLVQRHLQGPVSPPRPGAPAAPAGPGGTQEAFEGFWGGKGGGWERRGCGPLTWIPLRPGAPALPCFPFGP